MKILKRFSQTWLRKELTNNLSAFFCWLCIPSTLRTRMSLLPSPASSTPTHPPQRWKKVLNKVSTTGHLLLLCYNKDDLQPRHLCLWAASQVSSSVGLLHQHQDFRFQEHLPLVLPCLNLAGWNEDYRQPQMSPLLPGSSWLLWQVSFLSILLPGLKHEGWML